MKLSEYIKTYYNGSQADFARDNDMDRQLVWRMLDKGYWYVIGDKLMMHKRTINQKAYRERNKKDNKDEN